MADSTDPVQQIEADCPTFSFGMVPCREDGWGALGAALRASSDYLRYLTPTYRSAPKLRERAAKKRAARGAANPTISADGVWVSPATAEQPKGASAAREVTDKERADDAESQRNARERLKAAVD